MDNFIDVFQRQGGHNLIKQYLESGSFFTAIGEFLLLGHSRKALEILRLSTQLKTKQKLEKKYKKALHEFADNYDESLPHVSNNKVWICWFQGLDRAPLIVKKCYESVPKNLSDKEIILITADNMQEYVSFPDYIMDKWEKGQITDTHMSDLLRLELLIRYGEIWLDATVFCSGSNIPDYFFDSDLFMYQCLKPGRDGHSHLISSWLISAKTNNKVMMATQSLLYEYWRTHNSLIDYYLLHDFMSIVLEYFEDDWKAIVPRDNATPHILLLRLFEPYNEDAWNALKVQTPFHKLSYKLNKNDIIKENTYYSELILGGAVYSIVEFFILRPKCKKEARHERIHQAV